MPASYGSGCVGCNNSAGYGDYDGEISGGENYSGDSFSGGSNYYSDGAIGGDYSLQGSIGSPSMAPVTQPAK